MEKVMLISAREAEESRIAVLEDGTLEEFYIERAAVDDYVGNIYKGRVANVQRSLQAAFVDFGAPKNGFLHVSDTFPNIGEGFEAAIQHTPKKSRTATIEKMLKRGDEVPIQVVKGPLGNKGPAVTTYLSIPGRYFVLMPGVPRRMISKKISDEAERQRLLKVCEELKPPEHLGFIIRTAGEGRSKRELQRDYAYLLRLWRTVLGRIQKSSAPATIYQESDLVIRTIRDIFSPDVREIVVDSEAVFKRARDFLKAVMPRHRNRLRLYEGARPLFEKYGADKELERIYSRVVTLGSGATIVFEQTEALVAIDVNSGSAKGGTNPEEAALKVNLEAAREIARQIRMRDLGGVIVIDFIDMREQWRRREVEKTFLEGIRRDRAKTRVLRMSKFCIVEMTRQRMRTNVHRSIYTQCPTCSGTGLVMSVESVSLLVLRRLRHALAEQSAAEIYVAVHPDVNFYLQNRKRADIIALENNFGKRIVLAARQDFSIEDVELEVLDKAGARLAGT